MDICHTRVCTQRYGHGMHAWSKLAPRYVCMLPPCSVRLCFICSSPARCWCSSVSAAALLVARCSCASLTVARARLSARCAAVCPLLVPVCLTAVLNCTSTRCSMFQRASILLALARTWERGYGRLDITWKNIVVSAFMSVSLLSVNTILDIAWLLSSQPAGEGVTTMSISLLLACTVLGIAWLASL